MNYDLRMQLEQIKSPNLKFEFLEKLLKSNITGEERKFACIEMAKIHEGRSFYELAASCYSKSANCSPSVKERIELLCKTGECYLKANNPSLSVSSFKNAIEETIGAEKEKIKQRIVNCFLQYTNHCEIKNQYSYALRALERLVESGLFSNAEIIDKIISYCARLGKILEEKSWKNKKSSILAQESEKKSIKRVVQLDEELGIRFLK